MPAINLARWMHGEPPLIEWAWTMSDFDHRFGAVPTFYQEHLHWRHWGPPSTSLPWLPRISHHNLQEKATELHIKYATYNVSSLKEPAAAAFLRSQLQYHHIQIAGLQETRAKYDDVPDSDFYRFISNSDKGQGGCELWVNRILPIASLKGDPCYAKREHFQVICARPNLMIVTANIAQVAFTYCVAHAPHSGATNQQRERWCRNFIMNLARHTLEDNSLSSLMRTRRYHMSHRTLERSMQWKMTTQRNSWTACNDSPCLRHLHLSNITKATPLHGNPTMPDMPNALTTFWSRRRGRL